VMARNASPRVKAAFLALGGRPAAAVRLLERAAFLEFWCMVNKRDPGLADRIRRALGEDEDMYAEMLRHSERQVRECGMFRLGTGSQA
jgi:hypothetical protein